jgi:lipopolysaccharide transport system permease protein
VGTEESKVNFAIVLFVGMIVHGLFTECVNRAPGLILGNVNYVKKVIFPLEILPVIAMGSALFHMVISLVVLLGAILLLGSSVSWTILFFPSFGCICARRRPDHRHGHYRPDVPFPGVLSRFCSA